MLTAGCTSGEPPAPTGPLIGTSAGATSTPTATRATTTPPIDESCGPDDVTACESGTLSVTPADVNAG